jgi:dipeptidase E
MKSILLLSTSTLHGGGYLEYCRDHIAERVGRDGRVLFVPFARPGGITHEEYLDRTREALSPAGLEVDGLHEAEDPVGRLGTARALFVGGGNTFLLLRELYARALLGPIRAAVERGVPYVGSSAGSNVAGKTIGTTNDMPIVEPPSFEALGLVPFNLNPHYLDPDPDSTHMGETRETRIREFLVHNAQPVLGLREGAWLEVDDDAARIGGDRGARLFRRGREAEELESGTSVDELIGGTGDED